uniref:Glycine-rich protein n=1 Tax=Populus davidiana TaxID=266767 RepID=A0A6M2F9X9_9ROSI
MRFLLGFLVITSLCLSASSTPLDDKPFLPDPLQENNLGAAGTHEHAIGSIDDDSNERSGIVHSSKFAHGGSAHGGSAHGGARGGGATGAADNANGGGEAQGGRAVAPLVIAGAAANHRPNNHHNAGSRQENCIVPALITTTFVALIVH